MLAVAQVRTTFSSPAEAESSRAWTSSKNRSNGQNIRQSNEGYPQRFLVKDALTLKDRSERFDNVIDSGLFHVFNDEDRKKYVVGLAVVLKSSGKLFMMCFSDDEPGSQGPRRVSKKELQDAF